MKGKLVPALLLVFAIVVFTIAASSPVHAQGAKQQLNSIGNTGKVFDGSDGRRSGMDTKVKQSTGSVPEASPPAKVETSTGTAGGYSVGNSSSTAKGTAGKTEKTGAESAK